MISNFESTLPDKEGVVSEIEVVSDGYLDDTTHGDIEDGQCGGRVIQSLNEREPLLLWDSMIADIAAMNMVKNLCSLGESRAL